MALLDIQVPDIGDFDSVSVIEILVKVGDIVRVEQSLITVESDKASMEIPSSHAGRVQALKIQLGDKVKQGSVVLTLEATDTVSVAASPQAAPTTPEKPVQTVAAVAPVATQTVAAAPAQKSGKIEVHLPDIGDFKDVAVIEILAKVGDFVQAEQSLITVESDKASMEIPSSAAGKLVEFKVKMGDKLNIGDLIVILEGATSAASAPVAAPVSVAQAPQAPTPSPAIASKPVDTPAPAAAQTIAQHNPTATTANLGTLPHASPSIRKLARQLGVPLTEIKGSGNKGRITELDVQNFTRSVMSGATQTAAQQAAGLSKTSAASGSGTGGELNLLAWPKVDFSKFGATERKELSRIQKISGANLHRNWVMIPHVTNNDETDVTDLEAFRVSINKENEKSGVKVTMLAFVIKAMVSALKKFPQFNASLDGDALIYKQYFNIGFAADTPNGLVVPVLRDADKKGILQISQEMAELSKKARDGKLSPADMTGGCISISSLGGIGGTHFTPIINAPEVAILGLSKGQMKPVWDGKQFVPRLILPLSLSFDHRVIDGALAARFNVFLGQTLTDFRRVML